MSAESKSSSGSFADFCDKDSFGVIDAGQARKSTVEAIKSYMKEHRDFFKIISKSIGVASSNMQYCVEVVEGDLSSTTGVVAWEAVRACLEYIGYNVSVETAADSNGKHSFGLIIDWSGILPYDSCQ